MLATTTLHAGATQARTGETRGSACALARSERTGERSHRQCRSPPRLVTDPQIHSLCHTQARKRVETARPQASRVMLTRRTDVPASLAGTCARVYVWIAHICLLCLGAISLAGTDLERGEGKEDELELANVPLEREGGRDGRDELQVQRDVP
eukprot:2130283-Rhodomonas_salina.1